jgi:hypothetical protein
MRFQRSGISQAGNGTVSRLGGLALSLGGRAMPTAKVGMKLQVESGVTGLRLVGHGAGKSKQVGWVHCPLQCEAQVFVAPGRINLG